MKTKLLFSCLLMLLKAKMVFSILPADKSTAFEHLAEVNQEWLNYPQLVKNNLISFSNENERIRYHLLNVEQNLRSKSTIHLTVFQKENRVNMLNVLHHYALEMQFPKNTFHSNRQPYFIDVFGTHCAVGYLVMTSGYGNISQDISRQQNFAYVREIDSPELLQWASDYGFSLDELAWIQPGYPDATPYQSIGTGTNGPVVTIDGGNSPTDNLYIGGDFTMLGDVPCLNVAVYDGSQLSCLGGGVMGKVNDLKMGKSSYWQNIYVAGSLEHEGNSYPLTVFENNEWHYIAIPNRQNAEATALSTDYGSILLAIKTESNGNEVFKYSYINDEWTKEASFNGTVFVIEEQFYGGKFNEVTVIHDEENVTLSSENLIGYNYNTLSWTTFSNHVPDTVFSLLKIGNVLYVGGSASLENGHSNVVLASVINNIAQPLIMAQYNNEHPAIYDLDRKGYQSAEILLVGNLEFPELMYFGAHAYIYNTVSGTYTSQGYFNDPVRTVKYKDNYIAMGGDFTGRKHQTNNLLHLAKTEVNVGMETLETIHNLSLFPNPAVTEITIQGIEDKETFVEISDVQGKIVIPNSIYVNPINIQPLKKGIYFVNVTYKKTEVARLRFVKD